MSRADGLYEFTFLSIVKSLGQHYIAFRDHFVERVLGEISLLS